MTTDESNEQEAPGVHSSETDDDDTEGHKTMHLTGDPEAPGVRTNVRTNETDDDTEGHIKMHLTSDPDFAAQAPSRQTNATPEEDDAEGHVRTV